MDGWMDGSLSLDDNRLLIFNVTTGPLAPVLAQHKKWDTHPWGVLVLG
jgi:hypothetical protein